MLKTCRSSTALLVREIGEKQGATDRTYAIRSLRYFLSITYIRHAYVILPYVVGLVNMWRK